MAVKRYELSEAQWGEDRSVFFIRGRSAVSGS
jgi:hypothetical protein